MMTKAVTREELVRIAHEYGRASMSYGLQNDGFYATQVSGLRDELTRLSSEGL